MRDNRDILDKLKWLSTDMEDMEVPGDWLLPVNEAHSIIVRMREKLEKLRVENIQMQAALGYAICAEDERHIIPSNPFKCGVCDANRGVHDRIEQLEAEVKVWVNHTKTVVWSDSEECKMLTRINAALLEAPTVDIDVVVPDRDYSAMTPKDCYEAGLLDGVYQAREAIKAAARTALEGK